MNQRAILFGPPMVCAVACAVLAVLSPGAWGAADSVGYPGYAPTLGGLLYAAPVGAISAYAAARLWVESVGAFRVERKLAGLGAACFLAMTALAIAYCVTVGNASSYQGTFNAVSGTYDPTWNLNSFLMVSAGLGLFLAFVLALALKYFSLNAMDRGLDRVQGKDPMGTLMEGPV